MNFPANSSKHNDAISLDDQEIFEDSSFLARFEESSFQDETAGPSDSNKILDNSGLNVSALCCDEEISGYDKLMGRNWIYPTNYPVRDYQFNIIKAALVKNTLVSLPTGLGKTFIAAVVMYNFFRWYPLGKIVFTAPTRPLVAQQIEACYNIIAIPPEESVEMTGTIPVTTRKMHWKSKRVFFATPQVIYNDIKSGVCPADKIRCLVFDEAHRARGNYAYCSIVASLTDMGHKTYRILALSATPGSKVEDVSKVVRNIHIAHLELRTEACIDVAPYSHARSINTVLVALGPALTQLRQRYVEILDTYARRLKQLNILPHNVGNLSKGRVVMLYKEYQNKERGARHPQHNYIMKDFTLLIALYHGLELLVRHGSRVFLNFFDEHPEKSWMQADDRLTALLERLRDDLGVNPATLNTSLLPDGTVPEIPKDISFGHPKFDMLKEIMLQHFKKAKEKGQDTRAIVFCEYRESVSLVHCLLLQCRPLIVPLMFVGQGAGGKDGRAAVSQRQQLRAMQRFRDGGCNALVATCVAEEGLDVGSVDLIVCFDVSTRSPVRLVQRCGRTGRERSGQVHILVTEGREHQTLLDCMRQRDGLNRKIQQSREVQQSLFAHSPRMMPRDHTPACQKMYITVKQRAVNNAAKVQQSLFAHSPRMMPRDHTPACQKMYITVKQRAVNNAAKGQKDLLSMFAGKQSSGSSGGSTSSVKETKDALITKEEFQELYPEGFVESTPEREVKEYWTLSRESLLTLSSLTPRTPRLARWLEWQRTPQRTARVAHARDSCALAGLLRLCDAKRFQMPASTQILSFNTQEIANIATQDVAKSSPVKQKITKKKQKLPPVKSPSKRDGDIRALFSTATKSTKSYTKVIKDLHIPSDGSIPTNLIDLFVDMSVETTNTTKICYLCVNFGDCKFLQNSKMNYTESSFMVNCLKDPKFPDLSLIDDIDKAAIGKCVTKKVDESELICDHYIDVHSTINNRKTNFDLEFDFGSPDIEDDNVITNDNKVVPSEHSEKNFNIGDIEDIFAESSPEEAIENQLIAKDEKNTSDPKQALDFFGLDSIDDIFADSDDEIHRKTNEPETLKQTPDKTNAFINSKAIVHELEPKQNKLPNLTDNPPSPSILSGTRKRKMSTSPILCSQQNRRPMKKPSLPDSSTLLIKPKQLFTKTSRVDDDIEIIEDNNNKIDATPNASNKTKETSIDNTTNRSMFTITQLVNMINQTGDKTELEKSMMSKQEENLLTAIQHENNDRSCSPILLTQAEKKKPSLSTKKTANLKISTNASLIVLDSDSDSDLDNTVEYHVEDSNKPEANITNTNDILNFKSPATSKRKLDLSDDYVNASPFFSKKQKFEDTNKKPLSLQEKVIAAISTNKASDTKTKDNFNEESINYMFTSPMFASQKENLSPKLIECENKAIEKRKGNSAIEALQAFRRDRKAPFSTKFQGRDVSNKFSKPISQTREITFDDSDDDFVDNEVRLATQKTQRKSDEKPLVNHKIRKKKPKSDFLDLEAELSGDSSASGDELTDDSAGSLAEFICDAPAPDAAADMQALYLESVRSPIRGVFKIPQLPQKFTKEDILSQYVEEDDAYEMDSFCVDSHIGLTQLHDESESELELAEQRLEKRRKARRKAASHSHSTAAAQTGDVDSPVVKRKTKVKRQICSDSDDSS